MAKEIMGSMLPGLKEAGLVWSKKKEENYVEIILEAVAMGILSIGLQIHAVSRVCRNYIEGD